MGEKYTSVMHVQYNVTKATGPSHHTTPHYTPHAKPDRFGNMVPNVKLSFILKRVDKRKKNVLLDFTLPPS